MVEGFEIKLATIEDMRAVFDLSNDELVRANSFNQEKINWEDHKNWFKKKMNDRNCVFYLVKNLQNKLISQVRFDKNNNEADISISISPEFRGKGFGVEILKLTSDKAIKESNVKKINAYVKNENVPSKISFEKAGYVLKEEYPDKVRYEYSAE